MASSSAPFAIVPATTATPAQVSALPPKPRNISCSRRWRYSGHVHVLWSITHSVNEFSKVLPLWCCCQMTLRPDPRSRSTITYSQRKSAQFQVQGVLSQGLQEAPSSIWHWWPRWHGVSYVKSHKWKWRQCRSLPYPVHLQGVEADNLTSRWTWLK